MTAITCQDSPTLSAPHSTCWRGMNHEATNYDIHYWLTCAISQSVTAARGPFISLSSCLNTCSCLEPVVCLKQCSWRTARFKEACFKMFRYEFMSCLADEVEENEGQRIAAVLYVIRSSSQSSYSLFNQLFMRIFLGSWFIHDSFHHPNFPFFLTSFIIFFPSF